MDVVFLTPTGALLGTVQVPATGGTDGSGGRIAVVIGLSVPGVLLGR